MYEEFVLNRGYDFDDWQEAIAELVASGAVRHRRLERPAELVLELTE